MIDLNKNNISNAKKLKNKQKNANRFLCIVLACITLFISIVCIAVHNRNNEILAEQAAKPADTSATTQKENAQTTKSGKDGASSTDTPTQAPETESASSAPVANVDGLNVAEPGTLQEPTIITIDEANWHLTIVNTGYRIPDSYTPDLVYVCSSAERLDRKVATHYEAMFRAAAADGVSLTPCSGYRSYEVQERNYIRKTEFFEGQGYSPEEAKVKAATIIMPPGSSEHNLGYAMDIVCVEEWFENTAEFKWLQENAADYGFILRYPKDKQNITKVTYEPWHWRYVGVEAAKEMKSNNLVLEEYLGVS